jgi:hypothetical protein
MRKYFVCFYVPFGFIGPGFKIFGLAGFPRLGRPTLPELCLVMVMGDGNGDDYDDGDVGNVGDDNDGDGGGCLGFTISETSIFSYCRLRSDPRSWSDG